MRKSATGLSPEMPGFQPVRIFEVGFASRRPESIGTVLPATGAAYEPFEKPRQQLSFGFLRTIRRLPIDPGTVAEFQPIETAWVSQGFPTAAVAVAGEAPKCPSAGSGHLGGGPDRCNPYFAADDIFLTSPTVNPSDPVGITCPSRGIGRNMRPDACRIVPVSWRYNASAPRPRRRLARFGPSPSRRSRPIRGSAPPPSPASGESAGRS